MFANVIDHSVTIIADTFEAAWEINAKGIGLAFESLTFVDIVALASNVFESSESISRVTSVASKSIVATEIGA